MARLSSILRSGENGALLWFCPGCQMVHQIFVGEGAGPRWSWNGNVDRPEFSPSVMVTGTVPLTQDQVDAHLAGADLPEPKPLICHSFVVAGNMQFLADCTHDLAGQTVPIPPYHPDDE